MTVFTRKSILGISLQVTILWLAAISSAETALQFSPKHFTLLDSSQLQRLKSSQSAGAVYFFKDSGLGDQNVYLGEYDKAAGSLEGYHLTPGLVDCSIPSDSLSKECAQHQRKLYIYRNGVIADKMNLDEDFTSTSVVTSVLLVALLDELVTIETKNDRQRIERQSAGQTDIIHAFCKKIGLDHRIFMEMAYTHQNSYLFTVSTVPDTIANLGEVDQKSDCTLFVLHCRNHHDPSYGCASTQYRGDFTVTALNAFFTRLTWPKVVYQSDSSSAGHPCDCSEEEVCIYIFHSEATKAKAKAVVDSIAFDILGTAGLVVHQTEKKEEIGVNDPQLAVKKVGGETVKLEGSLTLDTVDTFLATHVFMVADLSPDAIDDAVVQVAYAKRQTLGQAANIPALTDKTFTPTVKGSDLTIVLFYLSFDSPGMLFLEAYQEAGRELASLAGGGMMSHPLARVNCFDWTDVCQQEGVRTYPTVMVYRDGGLRQRYPLALDKDVLVSAVRLLQANQPLVLKSREEVDSFVSGQLPTQALQMTDNLVLLRPSKSLKEVEALNTAINAFEMQMLFAIVSPDVDTDVVPGGAVLHVRLSDEFQPLEYLTENVDAKSIQRFLEEGQFHLLPELSHLSFPRLFGRGRSFGVLFYDPESGKAATQQMAVADVIRSQKFPDITLCKMSGQNNPVAEMMLQSYTNTIMLPTFAIVNHKKGEAFVLQSEDLTEKALVEWIQRVQDGSVAPTKMLDDGKWKPPGHYFDFLAIIEKEKSDCPSGNCKVQAAVTKVDDLNLIDFRHSRKHRQVHVLRDPRPGLSEDLVKDSHTVMSHTEL